MAGFVSGPIGNREFYSSVKIRKNLNNLRSRSGYVTNWYQSMVTTLGLLGLMNGLRRDSIQSVVKRSNSLS